MDTSNEVYGESADDMPTFTAPPFVHACRVLDCLWIAGNALSNCPGKAAEDIRRELARLRTQFAEEVLPKVMKSEVLG